MIKWLSNLQRKSCYRRHSDSVSGSSAVISVSSNKRLPSTIFTMRFQNYEINAKITRVNRCSEVCIVVSMMSASTL
jgi:hypothetical protein